MPFVTSQMDYFHNFLKDVASQRNAAWTFLIFRIFTNGFGVAHMKQVYIFGVGPFS